ncbi:hypothetical protein BDR07DRAFT_1608977 [Suillus spraguei]|nr:hypothetical protein BDR07DRAFT_1608977 [Suillus spraguei]
MTLLALSIVGLSVEIRNSRITLPMTRSLKFSNDTNLVQQDEARLAAFRDYSTNGRRAHVPLINAYNGYIVSVGIGAPPTIYNLVVDAATANTRVGARTQYAPTSSSSNIKQPVGQAYGSASLPGRHFSSPCWYLFPALHCRKAQTAMKSSALVKLTLPCISATLRTLLPPPPPLSEAMGYQSENQLSTFLLIASDACEKYRAATSADSDPATNLLTITPDQYDALQDLKLHIGGANVDDNTIYLVVRSLGRPTGSGLDFMNGYVFFQRFYTVFDTGDSLVSFATTPFTSATTN